MKYNKILAEKHWEELLLNKVLAVDSLFIATFFVVDKWEILSYDGYMVTIFSCLLST